MWVIIYNVTFEKKMTGTLTFSQWSEMIYSGILLFFVPAFSQDSYISEQTDLEN